MRAWSLLAICGSHLTGHGAPGQNDSVFLAPEVAFYHGNHQAGQSGGEEGEGFPTGLGTLPPAFLPRRGRYLGDGQRALRPY